MYDFTLDELENSSKFKSLPLEDRSGIARLYVEKQGPDEAIAKYQKIASDPEFQSLPAEDQQLFSQKFREFYGLKTMPAGYDVLGGLKDIGKLLYDIPVQVKGAIGNLLEDEDPAERETFADRWSREADERTEQRKRETSPSDRDKKVLPLPGFLSESGAVTRGDIQDTSSSTGFSAVSMGGGLVGGAAGLPVGPWTAAGGALAGSGAAAYKLDKLMVTKELFKATEQAIGRQMTGPERKALLDATEDVRSDHALWEAGPEAVGTALSLTGIGKIFGGAAKGATKKIIGGLVTSLGGELSTETITQIGQNIAEHEMGIGQGKEMSFSDPASYGQALKEVGPQVVTMTGLMGGGGYVAGKATKLLTLEDAQTIAGSTPLNAEPETVAQQIEAATGETAAAPAINIPGLDLSNLSQEDIEDLAALQQRIGRSDLSQLQQLHAAVPTLRERRPNIAPQIEQLIGNRIDKLSAQSAQFMQQQMPDEGVGMDAAMPSEVVAQDVAQPPVEAAPSLEAVVPAEVMAEAEQLMSQQSAATPQLSAQETSPTTASSPVVENQGGPPLPVLGSRSDSAPSASSSGATIPSLPDESAPQGATSSADVPSAQLRSITPEEARSIVKGKTEKPRGVDPEKQIIDQKEYKAGTVKLSEIEPNEDGDRYDGTVDIALAKEYAERKGQFPPVVLAELADGSYRVMDGGHRVSAARLRGDDTIAAVVGLSERTKKARVSAQPPASQPKEQAKQPLSTSIAANVKDEGGIVKQPWEMTSDEYISSLAEERTANKEATRQTTESTLNNLSDDVVDAEWNKAMDNDKLIASEKDGVFLIRGGSWSQKGYKSKKAAVKEILTRKLKALKGGAVDINQQERTHAEKVAKAIAEGKSVPAHVIEAHNRYIEATPDLAEKYGKKAEPAATEQSEPPTTPQQDRTMENSRELIAPTVRPLPEPTYTPEELSTIDVDFSLFDTNDGKPTRMKAKDALQLIDDDLAIYDKLRRCVEA